MKITSIKVSAARGFNHPHESYANFRFEIHQEVVIEEGDDPQAVLAALQEQTEIAAEAHKKRILSDIERLRLIQQGEEQLKRLKARQKQTDDTPQEIAETEAMLARLKATPLVLGEKTVHPGHPDHPETRDFFGHD